MCCAYRKLPAVLLVPVWEWSYGVGCLVEPEPVRESPGLRRGEREGQHHPMPQTDWRYFYWAPRRGPGCNYNTHTHIFMHAHTLLPDRERYPAFEFSPCLIFVCLIIVLCLQWHLLTHTWKGLRLLSEGKAYNLQMLDIMQAASFQNHRHYHATPLELGWRGLLPFIPPIAPMSVRGNCSMVKVIKRSWLQEIK